MLLSRVFWRTNAPPNGSGNARAVSGVRCRQVLGGSCVLSIVALSSRAPREHVVVDLQCCKRQAMLKLSGFNSLSVVPRRGPSCFVDKDEGCGVLLWLLLGSCCVVALFCPNNFLRGGSFVLWCVCWGLSDREPL